MLKFYLKSFFIFPITTVHELQHLFVALFFEWTSLLIGFIFNALSKISVIFSQPLFQDRRLIYVNKISLWPKRISYEKDGKIYWKETYGFVESSSNVGAITFLVSLAPLINLLILFYILKYNGIILFFHNADFINITIAIQKITWQHMLISWVLFFGGIPSSQDFKIAFKSLFTPSGILSIMLIFIFLHTKQ